MAHSSLIIFDFDRTIVDADSDATLIDKLREKQPPPEWEAGNHDWTPYMSDVFEHAYSAGLSRDDILQCIGCMRPTPGVKELIAVCAEEGWHIVIISDANTVFVEHWLKVNGLRDCITEIITNPAHWAGDKLLIKPYMHQTACARCPPNLCKKSALLQWTSKAKYEKYVYCGDGRNDFCPVTVLPDHAIVCPRMGYPLHDLLKKDSSSSTPLVKANIVPWVHLTTVLDTLYPGRTAGRIDM